MQFVRSGGSQNRLAAMEERQHTAATDCVGMIGKLELGVLSVDTDQGKNEAGQSGEQEQDCVAPLAANVAQETLC